MVSIQDKNDFKSKLWNSANKLRNQMDAAEYKHLVLGLIFLKYISDTFLKHKKKIALQVADPNSDFYLGENPKDHLIALEERDYYLQENIFWVPEEARWDFLRSKAKQPEIGQKIDKALTLLENENEVLRGKLDRRFGRAQMEPGKLGQLVDLISTIGFDNSAYNSADLLGEVYEFFLGKFATAEGKKGGQFYTPSHVVKTLVEVISPDKGRVYDPCCGSGGMFIQSERFINAHGGRRDDISIYGQESNPTTWRLAIMNLAIRKIACDLGKDPADTFGRDQHPHLKFDFILANPPFNDSEWSTGISNDDIRWRFGKPPEGNGNYAWLQHILWKLKPNGKAGVVLASGSLNSPEEKKIRTHLIQAGIIECILHLPSHLFINTNIEVAIWFFNNNKNDLVSEKIIFIDGRKLGSYFDRTNKILNEEEINLIADTVDKWRVDKEYKDLPGFCRSVDIQEIEKKYWTLEPAAYINYQEKSSVDRNLSEIIKEERKEIIDLLAQEKQLSDDLSCEVNSTLFRELKSQENNHSLSLTSLFNAIYEKNLISQKYIEKSNSLKKNLFKYLFIDFTPTLLKSKSEDTFLNPNIQRIIPDEFEDSPVGLIPKGWKAIKLGDLFEERILKVGNKNYEEYSCTNQGILKRDKKFTKKLSKSISKNKVAFKGDFVFGLSRSILNFGLMEDDAGCFSPAYKVFKTKGDFKISQYIYSYMLEKPKYFYKIVSASTREGQKISIDTMNNLVIIFPDQEDLLNVIF